MPGLIFSSGISKLKSDLLCKALCFDKRYYQTDLLRSENEAVLFSGYKGYPVKKYDLKPWVCFVDGLIYNNEIETVLTAIINEIAKGDITNLAALIEPLDGEFLLMLHNVETGTTYIINDSMGRLPVYIYRKDDVLIVSREISFVLNFIGKPSYIKANVALHLMFGFTFGSSTIWNNIERLEPHSVIQYNRERKSFRNNSFFRMNIGSETNGNTSEIFDQFKLALENRIAKLPNPSISLSGGLDSRLVAGFAADLKAAVPFTTFTRQDGAADLDVDCAKKILRNLNYSKLHDVVRLPSSTDEELEYILRIKAGLNNGAMGFILPYYRYLESQNLTSITGDGGDKFFVNLYPYRNLKSKEDFISYLLFNVSSLKIIVAARLAGTSESEILKIISNRVESYRLNSWNDSYAYFLIRERGINWVYEGEDRTRYLTWSTSPYYCPQVIKAAMKMAMPKKKHGSLFSSLFKLLPGNLETVLNPNWQLVPDDRTGIRVLFFKQMLKSRFPNIVPKRRDVSVQVFEKQDVLIEMLANTSASSPIEMDILEFQKLTLEDIVPWRLLSILFRENDTRWFND